MTKAHTGLLLTAITLSACGGGTTVDVSDEPPGENCAAGGVRLEVDGETFYACDEDQTATERVAFGAADNPCLGPALRVTTQVPGSDPTVLYVCEQVTPNPDSVVVNAMLAQIRVNYIPHEVECSCYDDPEDRDLCFVNASFIGDVEPTIASCLANAEALTPVERPASSDVVLECNVTRAAALTACLDAIPGDECTVDTELAIETCEDDVDNDIGGCAALVTDEDDLAAQAAWQQAFTGVIRLLRCPLVSDMLTP
jgi:hypothetical protein